MTEVPDEDDDIDYFCSVHPKRETSLTCTTCDRPVCIESCAVQTPVGFKCRECAKQKRSALARVPASKLALAAFGAVIAGGIAGVFIRSVPGIFFPLIIAAIIGGAFGTVVSRITGGFRDPSVARIAAAGVGLGTAWPALLMLIASPARAAVHPDVIITLIAAAIAAAAAWQRAQ